MAKRISDKTMGANKDVVERRLFAEEVDVLKGSGHPDRNHLVRLLLSDRAIGIVKFTLIGVLKTTKNIEKRRLPRAVRTDQSKYFSAFDFEAYSVACDKPAKSDCDVTTAQVTGHRILRFYRLAATAAPTAGADVWPACASWRRRSARKGRAISSHIPAGAKMSTRISTTPFRIEAKSAS